MADFGGIRVANRISETGTSTSFIKGDILVSNIRPYLNKIWCATFDGGCSPDVFVYRAKKELVTSPFLYNILANNAFITYVMNGAKGVKMPRGDKEQMMKYPCSIPTLQEQDKISSLLQFIDERIATQRRLIEDLEKLKSSINETLYATLTTDYMISFNEIGCDYGGLTGKSAEDFGKGKPFITYLNVYQNQVITDCNFDYVEIGDGEKQNKVRQGDLLITLSSETPEETGYTAVYMGDDKEIYLNSFCFGIHIPESELVYPPYLGYLTSTSYFRRKIIPFAQGSTRFNLHKPSLMRMKFSLPAKENQIAIFNALQLIVKKISTEEEILSNFTYQRNYLLTKLFI